MLGLGALQAASAAATAKIIPKAGMRSNFVTAEKLSSGLPARKPLARAGRRRDYSASIGRLARIDTVTLWSTAKLIAAKVANRIAMTDGQMILPRPLSGRVDQ